MGTVSFITIAAVVLMSLVMPFAIRNAYRSSRIIGVLIALFFAYFLYRWLTEAIPQASHLEQREADVRRSQTFTQYYREVTNPRPGSDSLGGFPGGTAAAVTLKAANLRSGPSTTFPILRTLPPNALLRVVQPTIGRYHEKSGWFEVNADGTRGWIAGDLIRPMALVEQGALYGNMWSKFWHFTFPEPTWSGKLLWFGIALLVDLVFHFMLPERLDLRRAGLCGGFFIVKGILRADFSWEEMYALMFLTALWAAVIDAIVGAIAAPLKA